MIITYFVNHYPKVSHTFIRREINALEKLGSTVHRVAIHKDRVVDSNNPDFLETEKTDYLLKPSILVLLKAFFEFLVDKPKATLSGFFLCLRMGWQSDRGLLKNIVYFLEGLRLAHICKRNNTQHLHAHFGTNSTDVAMYCSLILNIPYSFTVHGPEEFDRPLSINLSEKIKRAKFVFAITKFCKSQLFRWVSHHEWEKVKIIRCGLDASFFDDSVEMKVRQDGVLDILFIGRLCEQKGPLILLQSLKELNSQGLNVRVTFAGDGELRDDVETYVKHHSLDSLVNITGWIDSNEIMKLLSKADCMVLPSFAEGLPVAIMEALARKVPVITTRIAGIPELIVQNDTGFIVSPGSVSELTKAIKTFAKLPAEQTRIMVDNAYAAVKEMHNAEKEAVKINALFRGEDKK